MNEEFDNCVGAHWGRTFSDHYLKILGSIGPAIEEELTDVPEVQGRL